MLSEDELTALLDQLDELESRNDYLERLHILRTEGADVLLKLFPSTHQAHVGEVPKGHTLGQAGQLVLTDHTMVYDRLWGSK